jgi:glycosyltransferase involved in cell wall biosynthesis/uncharacterized protein YbaR (Trm112 family)/SAM-dependent methyltransferase
MTRVLCVIHYPVFGGPHNQALRLAASLRARGWETVVLLPDEPGNAAERLRSGGVEVLTIPLRRLRAARDPRLHVRFVVAMWSEVRAIRRVIRERSIDLVQIGGLVNPHAAIAARLEHVPVVWQLLDTRAPLPVGIAAMALVRELADVVMSTGRLVAVSYPGGGALRDRLVPFFPPVDVDLFRPRPDERDAVRSALGIPADAPVVGCVANINPQKGIVDLVRAFAQVRHAVPRAKLVIVGAEYATHASYSEKIRAAMGTAGLSEGQDVIFMGERADVERQLAGFDVFAFAPVPRGEGVSTVLLEAMAAGLPVVTTAVAGLPEAIVDGETGRLVPPLDTRSMVDAIVDLLTSPVTTARMGAAARSHAVARFGISACVADHVRAYDFALRRNGTRRATTASVPVSFASRLVCPSCRGPLAVRPDSIDCLACRRAYPIVDGIPVLLNDIAPSAHDEIDHLALSPCRAAGAWAHKRSQADHFDRDVVEEYEITRPHGTPRLFRFLLHEKFRRATAPLGPELVGASALTVCGGSGMDAEFLEGAGARVMASDLSLAAARRTRERARRYGLQITPIVADVEHLPFADKAFDLVFVHDGLHHLERPDLGLVEMARVAGRWVSVTEPARAAVTALAVRAGLALAREQAGNPVVRLKPAEVVDSLRGSGFHPLVARRYAMYYRHEPGRLLPTLSQRWTFPLARLGWQLVNALIGGMGNKMVVVAERTIIDGVAE